MCVRPRVRTALPRRPGMGWGARWIWLAVNVVAFPVSVASQGMPMVRDSAGVRIVEYGVLPERRAYEVGEPIYRVGWDPGDHQFGSINWMTGALFPDGRVAVGDWANLNVVVLNPDGTIRAVLGREGEGPGEFQYIASVTRYVGDTLVVEDDYSRRFTFYADTTFVRTERFDDPALGIRLMVSAWREGDALLRISSYRTGFTEPWLMASVVRHRLGTTQWDTVVTYPFVQRAELGQPTGFPAGGLEGVSSHVVVTALTDRTEIRVIPLEGGRDVLIRWEEDPPRFTDAFWEEYVAYVKSRNWLPIYWSEAARARVKEPLPVLGDMQADEWGRIWVSTFSGDPRHPPRYRVFAADGTWLGWVDMPPRFDLLIIGEDRVVGIERDAYDQQAVSVRPLRVAEGR